MPKKPKTETTLDNLQPVTNPPTQIDPEDAWQSARQHKANVTGGVKMTVAASVALGLELNRLFKELGYGYGGARSQNVTLKPWKELAPEKTGFSYMQLQRFMKTASAVRTELMSSRKKGDQAAKALLSDSGRPWNFADYQTFAESIGTHFKADTFRELMLETGLIKPPKEIKPPKDESKEEKPAYTEAQAAQDCIAVPILDLHRTAASPDALKEHLHSIPLRSVEADDESGEPAQVGLIELQTILSHLQEEIAHTIKVKNKK
jgi:hypothetical protein